jgi:hypothetical protein
MAAGRTVATSEGRGRPCCQSRHMAVAFSLQLQHINSSLQSVYIHAALGGDGPRWQPLNGSGCHALLARRQLEKVLEGGNGDGGIQLRPDGSSACTSAVERLAAATMEQHRCKIRCETEQNGSERTHKHSVRPVSTRFLLNYEAKRWSKANFFFINEIPIFRRSWRYH